METNSQLDRLLLAWELAEVKPTPEALCADCPELLEEFRELLQQAEELMLLLRTRTMADEGSASGDDLNMLGQIDNYRILLKLGEGGMGVVFKAEQQSPKRLVALKLVRAGGVSRQLVRRFEFEAEVLGRLEHPGIARIYEAGLGEQHGRKVPYFVMEFVDGRPLAAYVRETNPPLRARLELLLKIFDAVHYAHQRGVIHRDLKPGNILVDGEGNPKILDFGVARLMDPDVAATMHTDTGQFIGTLPYMSPEQAGGKSHDVDVRSDIYSLGVVAYEVLAGRRPYELKDRLLPEAVRIICEEEPTSLSLLDRSLRGDLETIIGKALAKERERRYASVSDFAGDIRRYLNDEPIAARPPSGWYQLRKFARRNKGAVGTLAAAFAVILSLAAGGTWLHIRRLKNERDNTRQALTEVTRQKHAVEVERDNVNVVLTFLTEDVFGGLSPERMPNARLRDLIVKVMIEPAEKQITQRFAGKPLIDATAQSMLAILLRDLGRADLALPHMEAALEHRRRILGDDHIDTLAAQGNRAAILRSLGRSREAEPVFKDLLARMRRVLGDDDPQTLTTLDNYAGVLGSLGRHAESEPLFKDAMLRRRRTLGEDHRDTLTSTNNYAGALYELGRFKEAEPVFKDVMDRLRRILGKDNPDTFTSLHNYAAVLEALGRANEAEPYHKEAMERARRVLGDDHPRTLTSMNHYGLILSTIGRTRESEPFVKEAMDRRRRVLGEDHPETITSLNNYAGMLKSLGRFSEAEPLFKEAVDRCRRGLGDDHPITLASLGNRGRVLSSLNRAKEAEPLFKEALDRRRRTLGADHPETLASLNDYGYVLHRLGRSKEAEPILKEALERRRRMLGEVHPDTIASLNDYALVLIALGRAREAEPLQKEAMERSRRLRGADHPQALAALNNYADTLESLGRANEAEPLFRESLDRTRRVFGEDHPETLQSVNNYANVLRILGRAAEAEPIFHDALKRAVVHPSLGRSHQLTRNFAWNLAYCVESAGRKEEAVAIRREYGVERRP